MYKFDEFTHLIARIYTPLLEFIHPASPLFRIFALKFNPLAYDADEHLHRLAPVGIHPHRPRLLGRGSHPCGAARAAVPHEVVGQALPHVSRNDDTII